MKNLSLSISSRSVPYIKELRRITNSFIGCVVMQQLDFRFEVYPDGFYKFMEPSKHALYRPGDSWTEELGVSGDEFRTAFDKIGVRYKSKGQYDKQADPFQGKFYCSYHDNQRGQTFYFRNHRIADAAIASVFTVESQGISATGDPPVAQLGDPDLRNSTKPSCIYTEITSKKNFKEEPKVNAIKAFPGKTPCAHEVDQDELEQEQSQQVESSLSTPTQSDTPGKSRSPVEDKSSAAAKKSQSQKNMLWVDEFGNLKFPEGSKYRLAKGIAAKRLACIVAISYNIAEFEMEDDDERILRDGHRLRFHDPKTGVSGNEDEMFAEGGELPLRKLRDIAEAQHGLSQGMWNKMLESIFQSSVAWVKSQRDPVSVLSGRSPLDIFAAEDDEWLRAIG
jgi:hypothetical protein